MSMNHDQAFQAFKNSLLSVNADTKLVDTILDEKAGEIITMATVKETLAETREYFQHLRLQGFIVTNAKLFDGKYVTTTIYQASIVAPIVVSMLLDFDDSITVGDMGECQIHVQQQPYLMPDGSLMNDTVRIQKQFNKDEQRNMSPMHWVNRAMSVRRSIYREVYHNDVLEPTDEYERILSAVRKFLDAVRLGDPPLFMQTPPREPQYLVNNPCSNFVLSVVMRGKMIFTIRF